MDHKHYKTWSRRYHTSAINGVVKLWTEASMFSKRAPSGRHAKKQRVLVDPTVTADAAPDASPSPPADSLSLVPPAALPPSDTLVLPSAGRAFPQHPRTVRKEVVCFSQVKPILKQVHDLGHPGVDATYELIGQGYVGITRDLVTAWVKRCTTCQERFRKRPPAPRFLNPIPTETFQRHVQADCVFFIDKRHPIHQVHVILHYICIATKWNELVLLSSKEGSVMRSAFWDIFTRIGPPDIIQSDNGSEFNNPEMNDLLATCGIEPINHRHGAPYKPDSQGVCERNHRTMQRILEIMTKEEKYAEWDFQDMLRLTQYWMNSYTHRSTKQSAYLLVFGRFPPLMRTGPAVSMDEIVTTVEEEILSEKAAAAKLAKDPEKTAQVGQNVETPSPPEKAAAASVADTPMEVEPQSLEVHQDRQQAAQRNHSIYQQQWQTQANRGLQDQTFTVGELVLLQVIPPKTSGQAKLAKQIDKQRVLVMEQLAYSKYTIYTEFGFLKDSVHANALSKAPAAAVWPEGLRNATDPLIAHSLLQQYRADKHGRKQTVLTINSYMNRILTHHYQPVAASVEMRQPKPGDSDFQPVVRIRQKRQRK